MNAHTKLSMHLERHAYKRGQFKGDAPADPSRRSKNHLRVLRGNAGQMIVRMYNTNILSVTADNQITIHMNGWHTSTTKANLNDALYQFIGWGSVESVRLGGYSQLAITAKGKTYRYYDGMTFDAEGNPTCPLKPFTKQRVDRAATAEFRKDIAESGFKDVFPVLFAAAEPDRWVSLGRTLTTLVTQEFHANSWPDIAARFKRYHDDHKAAYRAIVATCTSDMKELYDTDVTVI